MPTSMEPVKDRWTFFSIIFWLASGTFVIGCSEFAAMSMLPYYARTFGVTEPVAGYAVSAYALGVVVGAPLIATLWAQTARKKLLVVLMGIYAVGNFLTAVAGSMMQLDIARFLTGLPHGAYFGIAMLFAADIAGKGRRAQAVSYVIIGLTIGNIIGVPVISLIGQHMGWRVAFCVIAAIAAMASFRVWRTAPNDGPHPGASPLVELGALKNRDVLLTLSMGAIGFGGMFAVYSYFSATLIAETDSPEWMMSAIFCLFGLGGTFGNWLAGRLSGGRLLLAAGGFQAFLGLAAGLYAFAVGNWMLMAGTLFLIGIGGGMVVPLQTRLMDVAGQAQTLAAAMNHAAFNFANALGPWLAGLALAAGLGPRAPGLVGVGLSVAGLLICAVMITLQRGDKA